MGVAALIPASGVGKRMFSDVPKQFISFQNKPLLAWTLDNFQNSTLIDEIVLVVEQDKIERIKIEIIDKYNFSKVRQIVAGGKERYNSVHNGLEVLSDKIKWVAIHDGARPFLSEEVLRAALKFAEEKGSAVLATPIFDTLKQVNDNGNVIKTLNRSSIFRVQTPQIFKKNEIVSAYKKGMDKGYNATDDASMMEIAGFNVFLCPGEKSNIKITTPDDLKRAEQFFQIKGGVI